MVKEKCMEPEWGHTGHLRRMTLQDKQQMQNLSQRILRSYKTSQVYYHCRTSEIPVYTNRLLIEYRNMLIMLPLVRLYSLKSTMSTLGYIDEQDQEVAINRQYYVIRTPILYTVCALNTEQ